MVGVLRGGGTFNQLVKRLADPWLGFFYQIFLDPIMTLDGAVSGNLGLILSFSCMPSFLEQPPFSILPFTKPVPTTMVKENPEIFFKLLLTMVIVPI